MNLRPVFVAITAFWIVMNIWLWRVESRGGGSSAVPLQTVAERLLDAADSSTLQIRQRGNLMGQLRWTPAVLHDAMSATNRLADEGMVTKPTGYAVDIDINLIGNVAGLRGRGAGRCEFDADRQWRSLEFRFLAKPMAYEISLGATNLQLNLRVLHGNEVVFRQNLSLKDPESLLGELDGSLGGFGLLTPGLLSGLGILTKTGPTNAATIARAENLLRWEARTTELRISQHGVRAYRLTGRLLDRYKGDVWIGRDGRLLRVLLPGEIELRDENLPLVN